MVETSAPLPDIQGGINYWASKKANLATVLGGFDKGTLPRVDALTSRQFLVHLLPELSTVPSAIRPLHGKTLTRRTRALDVGAGIGRVTATVLLHLVDDVVLLEPVAEFVNEAVRKLSGPSKQARNSKTHVAEWKSVEGSDKTVTAIIGTLQDYDPRIDPFANPKTSVVKRIEQSSREPVAEDETGFDVVWCQWCLGHMSDEDLVSFLIRAKESLRSVSKGTGELPGLIVVKENVCLEVEKGVPKYDLDETDKSLTRSDSAWKKSFSAAGLKLIAEKTQEGFPIGLYPVKMYALR